MLDNIDLMDIEALEKEMYLSGDKRSEIIREFLDNLRLEKCVPWFSDVVKTNYDPIIKKKVKKTK